MIIKQIARATLPEWIRDPLRATLNHRRRLRDKHALEENNRQTVVKLLAADEPIKLELGAGDHRMEGWTAVDSDRLSDLCLDLQEPLPFPDESIEAIYSSHLLEHLPYRELTTLLKECRRVLRTGSWFKAAVPNARIFFDAYYRSEDFDADKYCVHAPAFNYHSKIDYVNYIAYMDGHHHHLFDEENLAALLVSAGFREVGPRAFDPRLDHEDRDFESIYVVGYK